MHLSIEARVHGCWHTHAHNKHHSCVCATCNAEAACGGGGERAPELLPSPSSASSASRHLDSFSADTFRLVAVLHDVSTLTHCDVTALKRSRNLYVRMYVHKL